MLKIIKEHEDAFRLARIDAYKLGEISKKAIKKHATVEDIYAARLGAVEGGIAPDALEEAYLVKPFNEFAADDNIPKIAETLANELAKVGIHVDRKRVEEAFRRAKPVVESLVKDAYMNPTHEIISSTIDEHQYIIKGIETNKELRQFLAEISGKKIEKKPPAKFKQVQKQVEAELRAKGVPEEEIYRELEKKGIPRELAKVILDVKAAETTPTSQIHRMIERLVGRDPQKAKALLEAMERTGKLVPVPKYWANIVSKIATGEITERELLEALAVSKVFHTAYSKAIAKAAEKDEPESTVQRMMFIKRVLDEAHRETMEALKEHPVYGEFIRMKAPAIEREIKATAETLSKTYYAKARGDPSLSVSRFIWLELSPQIGAFAGIISTLGIALEDFSVLGKLDETTARAVYPQLIKDTAVLSWKVREREYVGITVPHELVRSLLAR